MVTITFRAYKGTATYGCTCDGCGKTLKRTVTVEHTVNPFNTNDDGSQKTALEVTRAAHAEAAVQAAAKEGGQETCRDCEEKPMRDLLLAMAADPERIFPRPEKHWNSPMHYLEDRKQVSEVHLRCACDSDCCSGWKKSPGYKITKAGLERAAKFKVKAA